MNLSNSVQAVMSASELFMESTHSNENKRLAVIKEAFIDFLATANRDWEPNQTIKKISVFGEDISCTAWEGRHFITGTDIVKVISIRYRLDGHELPERKKFEEGVFSDLRNLKPGLHSILERSHSKFLDFLYLNNCVRTHKKQKVFFWECVPHEKLYQESLKRDEKRGPDSSLRLSVSSIQKLASGNLKKEEIMHMKSILNERLQTLEGSTEEDLLSVSASTQSTPSLTLKRKFENSLNEKKKYGVDQRDFSSLLNDCQIGPTMTQPLPSIRYLLNAAPLQSIMPSIHYSGSNIKNCLPSQQTVRQKKCPSRWNYDPTQRHIPPLPPPIYGSNELADRLFLPGIQSLQWKK